MNLQQIPSIIYRWRKELESFIPTPDRLQRGGMRYSKSEENTTTPIRSDNGTGHQENDLIIGTGTVYRASDSARVRDLLRYLDFWGSLEEIQ